MDKTDSARIDSLEHTGDRRTANENDELQTLYLNRWLQVRREEVEARTPEPVDPATTRNVNVYEGDTVDIRWNCHDGTIYHQRVKIPVKHATLIVVPPKRT